MVAALEERKNGRKCLRATPHLLSAYNKDSATVPISKSYKTREKDYVKHKRASVGCELYLTLPVIMWYAIFTVRPKCQQRTAFFAECEARFSRFLLMHRLNCWSARHILCGNLIEFDGKNVYILGHFVFINTSMSVMLVRKTLDALHNKKIC